MMTFRELFLALCRREVGVRLPFLLVGWFLLGAGAAAARAWLAGGESADHPVVRLLGNFGNTLAIVLAFAAAFQLIAHISEDRLQGWLHGWCGSGGERGSYVGALYLASVSAIAAAFAAAVVGFALTAAVLDASAVPLRAIPRLVLGIVAIAGVSAYALVLGTLIQRVSPAVLLGVVLFLAPVIAVAIITVTRDLPDAPESARWWLLHLPTPVPTSTVKGFLRQTVYIAVAVSLSGWLARHRIGRTT